MLVSVFGTLVVSFTSVGVNLYLQGVKFLITCYLYIASSCYCKCWCCCSVVGHYYPVNFCYDSYYYFSRLGIIIYFVLTSLWAVTVVASVIIYVLVVIIYAVVFISVTVTGLSPVCLSYAWVNLSVNGYLRNDISIAVGMLD